MPTNLQKYPFEYSVLIFATPNPGELNSDGLPVIQDTIPQRYLKKTYVQDGTDSTVVYPQDDILEIHVDRTIGQVTGADGASPPQGNFSLILKATREPGTNKTWKDVIRPMDYVEIRVSQNTKALGTGTLSDRPPILMRGLVDRVSESFSTTNNSTTRYIAVEGRDLMKILTDRKVVITSGLAFPIRQSQWLAFYTGGGLGEDPTKAIATLPLGYASFKEWLDRVTYQIASSWLVDMNDLNKYIPSFKTIAHIPPYYKFYGLYGLENQTEDLPLWNFYKAEQAYPFAELFIVDEEDAPYLVWRLVPYLDGNGNSVWGNTSVVASDPVYKKLFPVKFRGSYTLHEPGTPVAVSVGYNEILNGELGPSDEDIFTFVWTFPTWNDYSTEPAPTLWQYSGLNPYPYELGFDVNATLPSDSNALIFKDPWIRKYGFRPKKIETSLIDQAFIDFITTAPDGTTSIDTSSPSPNGPSDPTVVRAVGELNLAAYNIFGPLYAFQKGNLVLRGNENIRAGQYIQLVDDAGLPDTLVYVEKITHEIIVYPSPAFKTTVSVSRGLPHQTVSVI